MQNELQIEIYTFQNENIRVLGTYENPYFIVKDVCNVLDITNPTIAVRNIPDKWKSSNKLLDHSLKGQDMLTVTEAGLYKLIMRSTKPIAEKFQEWMCEEVLPSIRKKGEYVLEEYKKKLEEQQKALEEKTKLLEQKEEHIRKLQREKQVVDGKNCVYLCTTDEKEAEGIYTVGKASDIERRLKEYNESKLFNFKMIKYISCKSVKLMDSIETILLAKFNKYKIVNNRDVFQLPQGKNTNFFTQWYDYVYKFCEDIEEDIKLEERTEEEKQKLLIEQRSDTQKKYRKDCKKDLETCPKSLTKEYFKEYREENKDELKQKRKEYNDSRKDYISKYNKEYKSTHPEKVKELYQKLKESGKKSEYDAKYTKKRKEKETKTLELKSEEINEKIPLSSKKLLISCEKIEENPLEIIRINLDIDNDKQYIKEEVKEPKKTPLTSAEKQRKYREKNKEECNKKTNERNRSVVKCECGEEVCYGHLSRHKKTKRHLNNLNIIVV
jgi:prophage antirepressor-like protein